MADTGIRESGMTGIERHWFEQAEEQQAAIEKFWQEITVADIDELRKLEEAFRGRPNDTAH